MKKLWIIMLAIIVIIIGILTGLVLNRAVTNEDNNILEDNKNMLSQRIEDECTEEWEYLHEQAKIELETNSNEEKISPNCSIIFKRFYKECNHIINDYKQIPQSLINKTEEELQNEYPNWKIEKYSSTEIILYKEFDSDCGQHYILRNDNGKIVVYLINTQNEEEVYEKTEISVEYLPENDKIQIENGIRVDGKENLNKLIENFE